MVSLSFSTKEKKVAFSDLNANVIHEKHKLMWCPVLCAVCPVSSIRRCVKWFTYMYMCKKAAISFHYMYVKCFSFTWVLISIVGVMVAGWIYPQRASYRYPYEIWMFTKVAHTKVAAQLSIFKQKHIHVNVCTMLVFEFERARKTKDHTREEWNFFFYIRTRTHWIILIIHTHAATAYRHI